MERLGRDGDIDHAQEELPRLEREIERLIDALRAES
jgi:hypothetical protein